MRINQNDGAVNPYHYVLNCIGGKWKMTILHEIYTHRRIRFNRLLKMLPVSEKVLSQQIKDLLADGLVERIVHPETTPPTVDYVLSAEGRELVPALDILFIWGISRMKACDIPIDADAFTVQKSEACIKDFTKTTIYLKKVANGEVKTASVTGGEGSKSDEPPQS